MAGPCGYSVMRAALPAALDGKGHVPSLSEEPSVPKLCGEPGKAGTVPDSPRGTSAAYAARMNLVTRRWAKTATGRWIVTTGDRAAVVNAAARCAKARVVRQLLRRRSAKRCAAVVKGRLADMVHTYPPAAVPVPLRMLLVREDNSLEKEPGYE
eukprot:TRINITY_DN27979_c0_g1_i1.p1 TRINITY_DN27979_c0_g1~~TRINITY_DN27979_c0_g1_i1.p1  ORF type:complete len:154 (+),score=14.77 TRINITY_DN27979_c0_g1_i1:54-515(+)